MAKYITVAAGPNVKPGQIAICEEHDDHPEDALGVKMAYVVAGDPKVGSGKVGMTGMVALKISKGELVEVSAKEAKAAAESSEDARELDQNLDNASDNSADATTPEGDGGQRETAEANQKVVEKEASAETQADKNTADAIKAASKK